MGGRAKKKDNEDMDESSRSRQSGSNEREGGSSHDDERDDVTTCHETWHSVVPFLLSECFQTKRVKSRRGEIGSEPTAVI